MAAVTVAFAPTMLGRILVVDDEPGLLKAFRYCLEDAGYTVSTALSAEQAELLVHEQVFDACFLDMRIGNVDGLELLPRLRGAAPWLRVIVVTAYSSIETAVGAMQAGASDYLVKPCSPEQIRVAARKQVETRRLEQRIEELERVLDPEAMLLDSASPAMAQTLAMARQVSESDANVLLLGESGTGKGVMARAIHGWSRRAKAPMATVNCPALSADLFESELFGHCRGAFTGAVQNSPGRVSQADGGTLFLDEIGEVPLPLQAKLLRFLQDKEYERVGDPVTRRADVRVVAATNRDLSAMVRAGTFREDLLYRLDVIRIDLPALRERSDDIATLAQRFLAGFARQHGGRARSFSTAALDVLRSYAWPGNIRELHNVVERASILCSDEVIEPRHLSLAAAGARATTSPRVEVGLSLADLERQHILRVLADAETLDQAARSLGIDSSTLYRKRKQYGI